MGNRLTNRNFRKCCNTRRGKDSLHDPSCDGGQLSPVVVGMNSEPEQLAPEDVKPNWAGRCLVCNQSPIVPITGMCGPCTFGEAETAGGNW